jgi:hypothetical protein
MVFVKITEIRSITDPETGEEGKQIHFNEVRKAPVKAFGQGDDVRIIQEIMNQLKMIGLPMMMRSELKLPKLIIFLTDEECEKLQIDLEVNKTYDLRFWMGKIELTPINP